MSVCFDTERRKERKEKNGGKRGKSVERKKSFMNQQENQ